MTPTGSDDRAAEPRCSTSVSGHVDRGDGSYLANDMVAAPGLLSEVSFGSAGRGGSPGR